MRNSIWKWILIGLAVGLCGLIIYGFAWIRQYQALADDEPQVVLSPDIPDIPYCTFDGVPLLLDLYYPADVQPPWQVVVYAHGGSFTAGDKRQGSGLVDIPVVLQHGYAVAAINYRLMPEHPFPAEIIDAKCAIRFLRAHTGEYQLKTSRIGLWGGSAGGHLAALVGLTNDDPSFEAGEHLDQSSRVEAVVEMFGPTDLTTKMGWLQRLLLRRAFGTDEPDSPLLHQASPINYVRENAPPFLILHGEQDSAVPLEQAQLLSQKLLELGDDVQLVVVKNANHNFKPTGGEINPSREAISNLTADFFDLWLK